MICFFQTLCAGVHTDIFFSAEGEEYVTAKSEKAPTCIKNRAHTSSQFQDLRPAFITPL